MSFVLPYILALTFLFLREGSFVGDSDRVHWHLNIISGPMAWYHFSSVYSVYHSNQLDESFSLLGIVGLDVMFIL
jgi:hypothetical protein